MSSLERNNEILNEVREKISSQSELKDLMSLSMAILADTSKSCAIIADRMTEKSLDTDDLEYFIECIESRSWELGVDVGEANNPLDSSVAYKKGKIDAYNSIACALRKKLERENERNE